MSQTRLSRQLEGFSLTTAEILYCLPDHPRLLQSYIWQDYDLAPKFPKHADVLDYWVTNLDGELYRVRVANPRLIAPQEFRFVEGDELKAVFGITRSLPKHCSRIRSQ